MVIFMEVLCHWNGGTKCWYYSCSRWWWNPCFGLL